MSATTYETAGGIRVQRTVEDIAVANAIEPVIHAPDTQRGFYVAIKIHKRKYYICYGKSQ
jgi:hypothetical protein